MNFIIRLLVTTLIVVVLANILPGVTVDGFTSGLWVAVVMGILNMFLKPLLVFLTLPATIITLGLFLFVINAVIIMLCSYFVGGFHVNGFWSALLFSVVLTFVQSILNGFLEKKQAQ